MSVTTLGVTNASVRSNRNKRNYNKVTVTKTPRDAHGRPMQTNAEKQAQRASRRENFTQYLKTHPLAGELIDQIVTARQNFIVNTMNGGKIDDPVYLWKNPQSAEEGMSVQVVPKSSIDESKDKWYTSARDMLDMIYYNTAYDDDGNVAVDYELPDIYDYASQKFLDRVGTLPDGPDGGRNEYRDALVDYLKDHGYDKRAGWEPHTVLQQQQEWQEPTTAASALGLLAPRVTAMKLDPEMQTMVQAGNTGNEVEAAGGDIAELALSAMIKPFKFLRWLSRLPRGERLAMRLAPRVMSAINGRTPELARMFARGIEGADNKLMNLSVKHPLLASSLGSGIQNSIIYGAAKGYDEVTDPNNYFHSSPFNLTDLGVAGAVGAGVPLAIGGAGKLLKIGEPTRSMVENFEAASMPQSERVKIGLARSLMHNNPRVGSVRPSDIPDEWIDDLYGVPSWNGWLNARLNRFENAHPGMHYAMRRLPESNIAVTKDTDGLLSRSKMGFGDDRTAIELVEDPRTGRLGRETATYSGGRRDVAGREETNKFKRTTPYSVSDWRNQVNPATLRRMDQVDPDLAKSFSKTNSYDDDTFESMMSFPGRDGEFVVETPNEFTRRQSILRENKKGEKVADFRGKEVFASDEGGVPLPFRDQVNFRRARHDRGMREAASSDFTKKHGLNSTPIEDIEELMKVPGVAKAGVTATLGGARTIGRNINQGTPKNTYKDDKEGK